MLFHLSSKFTSCFDGNLMFFWGITRDYQGPGFELQLVHHGPPDISQAEVSQGCQGQAIGWSQYPTVSKWS